MLLSLAAAVFAFALTWLIVVVRPFAANEAAQAQQSQSPVLATTGSQQGDGSSNQATDETPPDADSDSAVSDPSADEASPAPGDDSGSAAAQQARNLNDLLSSSSSARSSLSLAIARTSRCEPDGVDAIQDITASRRDQLAAAKELPVTALTAGAELKDALVDALSASYDADAAFLTWARNHVAEKCTGEITEDRDYRRGLGRSETAQVAKRRFAEAWRPIAETYDLPAWKPSQI
ncbi:hypothetical protein [Nonomuraea jiangxiensis]|uniref:Uncharacterized protein n=1 Tax=Nonomuraea jiangxiensis TaxID=633440 RepID=A0A1G7Z5Z1_9ACTN|nr:hypothetical protein [Nonomuraea jiangxiensis]SDH03916.1 hypothetical protein SAMN05421869_101316 [Nonomuraea jiangxiensis]